MMLKSEVMKRLLALHDKNPERFMAFYHAVTVMIAELPEGGSFHIADRCSAKSIDVFRDVAFIVKCEEGYNVRRDFAFRRPKKPARKTFIEQLAEDYDEPEIK